MPNIIRDDNISSNDQSVYQEVKVKSRRCKIRDDFDPDEQLRRMDRTSVKVNKYDYYDYYAGTSLRQTVTVSSVEAYPGEVLGYAILSCVGKEDTERCCNGFIDWWEENVKQPFNSWLFSFL